ncbi:RNase adapter RapZ [Mangrovicoccus algicola]|uniref:RNase adapter RapZ n=1 Tax=Mangrovicoccus algicola TaxID=2771008 RepID=A0A8J7D046_9RHOB|nr:RNase adapter RapZ [Mangrovicoccus algicola]MBE3638938.1 RNase adapter RapZ [Mangrovicoccus algicola]
MTARSGTAEPEHQTRVIFVTGPSGAGRSTAIRALEDMGCETVDNLPLSLVPALIDGAPGGRPLVLGLDVRNREFSIAALIEMIGALSRHAGVGLELIYLDARADILVRRYSETRRRHPLAPAETAAEGVERELDLMEPIRARADFLIDTSDLTPHELRAELDRWFGGSAAQRLALSVHSFSYKRGLPRGIDMVFDVRFLRNPYWSAELRALDGRNPAVATYISEDPRFDPFFSRIADLAELLLPAYLEEGKSHLTLGFGCTGGQHRSVALAEKLASALAAKGWGVSIRHHELERRGMLAAPAKPGDAA